MTLTFALLAAVLQDLPDRPVSLELRGTRLENAVQTLSKVCGGSFKVDPALKDLVVAIRVEKRSSRSLLKTIATTMAADWVRKGDDWVLERKPELAAKLQKEEHDLQINAVRARQQELANKVGDTFWTQADTQAFLDAVHRTKLRNRDGESTYNDGPQIKSALNALATWLFAHVDLGRALESKSSEPVVFTTAATIGQTSFDKGCRAQIDKFLKLQPELAQTVRSSLSNKDEHWPYHEEVRKLGDAALSPIELEFTVSASYTNIRASLSMYDSNGHRIGLGAPQETFAFTPDPPESEILKKLPNRLLDLSPQAAWCAGLVGNPLSRWDKPVGKTLAERGFSKEDKERWAKVEEHDPLSYVATDIAFALHPTRDIVAVLPDQMVAIAQLCLSNRKLSPVSFAARARPSITVEEQDGAVVLRPTLRLLSERLRIDRHALGRMLRGLNRDGIVTVKNWSQYAINPGVRNRYSWAQFLMMNPYLASGYETPHGFRTLEESSSAFIGTLGDIAFGQLELAGKFQVNKFDAQQVELLNNVGSMGWPRAFTDEKKWYVKHQPSQVVIELLPCEIGQHSVETPTGAMDIYFDPSKPDRERLDRWDHAGLKVKKQTLSGKCFRFTINWRDAPPCTYDLIEFGKPIKS